MILLPIDIPEIHTLKRKQIKIEIHAIYGLITFSRKYFADDELNSFLLSAENLKEL